MQGKIVKIISDTHVVSSDGCFYSCKCRGLFRKEHITPLVGDYVLFDKDKLIIEKILPRKNEFERPKVANIDQAFLITSVKNPDFSFHLLDRLLVLMELHHVTPIICITKEDLLTLEEKKQLSSIYEYYQSIGYQVLSNQDLAKIKDCLSSKTTCFTGQTGAGKSTLLNRICPDLNLEVGEISIALGRGKHTTRVTELFEYNGGYLIDTPGFSALDFSSYTKEDIRNAFIEFDRYPCLYRDCFHTNEAECRIKEAVSSNNIIRSRYENYLCFLKEGKS